MKTTPLAERFRPMSALWAWFLDVLLGPRCGVCNWRARGPRSLIAHLWEHAGEVMR